MKEHLEAAAKQRGWKLNPDGQVVAAVIAGLEKRKEKFGYAYCPCRVIPAENKDDIVCPCKMAEVDVEVNGICYCRLFVKG